MLKPSRIAKLTELADSKALTAKARNAAYSQIMDAALDWSVITIPAAEIDRLGLHVCNVAGMRRALAGLCRQARLRADRRVPGPRASAPGPGDVEGRPGRGLRGGCLGDRQGHQGRDDVRTGH